MVDKTKTQHTKCCDLVSYAAPAGIRVNHIYQRSLHNVRHVNVTVGVMAHGKLWLGLSYLVYA